MEVLSTLRSAVDAFFERVTVNVEDRAVRENRLKLLNEIRAAIHAVADFSRIEGAMVEVPTRRVEVKLLPPKIN